MEKSTDDGAQRHDKFIQNCANFPKCAQLGYLFKCFQMRRENPPREQQQTAGRRNATAKTYLGGGGQEIRSAPTQRSRRMQLLERAWPRTSPSQQTREEVNQLRWDRREGKRPTTKKAGHNPTTNKEGTKPTPTDGPRTHTATRAPTGPQGRPSPRQGRQPTDRPASPAPLHHRGPRLSRKQQRC